MCVALESKLVLAFALDLTGNGLLLPSDGNNSL
jgi:hypothetical protein